jgi:hypothetical protein
MNDRSWRVVYLFIAVGGAIAAALMSGAPAGFAEQQGRRTWPAAGHGHPR